MDKFRKGTICKVVLLFVMLHIFVVGWSQKKDNSDSLISVYVCQKTVFNKLKILYQLSNTDNIFQNKKFIDDNLINLTTKLKTNCDSGFYYFIKGNLIISENNDEIAKSFFIKSLNYFNSCNKYSEYQGALCSQIAHLYLYDGKRDSSLYYYKKAIEIYKNNKVYKNLSKAYYDLGLEYYIKTKVTDAIENFYKSIKEGIKQKKYDYVSLSYRLLSKINRDQNTNLKYNYIDTAIFYAEKSNDNYALEFTYFLKGEYLIDENKFEEGYEIAKKIENIYKKDTINRWIKSDYFEYLSRYYEAKGDYLNCIKFYNKTIQLNIKSRDYKGKIGWMYNNMGDVCIKAYKYKEAIIYFDSAISYSNRFNDLNLKWYAYYNVISAYQGLKDYKTALNYFWKYDSINNVILTKENGEKLADLQTKYEVENKEIQISALLRENIFKQDRINKENFEKRLLLFLIVLCVAVILLATLGYVVKRRDNKKLSKQKQDIIDKTELLNKQAAEIAMYKAQMNPHFIFNAINSVQRFVIEKKTSLALEYISDLSKLIRTTLNFSDKEIISIKDEIEYLKQYVRFEKLRCDDKFEFNVIIDKLIDEENTGILPMLIQPFIENAVKHGIIPKDGNGKIILKITKEKLFEKDILKISVADDGVGLSSSLKNKNVNNIHKSKGTEITQNRLIKLNEKYFSKPIQNLNISDILNENKLIGTKVEIVIPYIEIL